MVSEFFLISEIRENNRMAFTIIYDKYHRKIYAFVYKYVRNHAAAEDIVQHTFLKLWEIRKKLNPHLSLGGYLFNIAKNHTLNVIRNYNARAVKNAEYYRNIDETEELRINETGATDMLAMLDKAIEKLPSQRKAICRMKISEGLSNQQIADQLGISVNTVKNQYNSSIKQLRTIMGISLAAALVINILPPV